MNIESLLESVKILVSVSIFFVWVVRYSNIVEEFNIYRLPNWLRDTTGILKLSFATMLLSSDSKVISLGASGIIILMLFAQIIHLKSKSLLIKRIPSMILIILSLAILYNL